MIEWNSSRPKQEFEVKVGLMSVVVRGASQEEAITNARAKLSNELPRMWDIIHGLDDSRFDVCQVESN